MAQEKPIAPQTGGGNKLRVRRGQVESVDLYEIKDTELDVLERVSPADLQLNFAIFLLSVAFSGFCALLTTTFSDDTVQTAFMVVSVCGLIIGSYLRLAWWRNRSSLKTICERIRDRLPPDSISDETEYAAEDERPKG